MSTFSPLRYPGAKRRLTSYIVEVLRLNGLQPKLFVEPFAGGASVSLQLLEKNLVDAVALGEKDPLVASFWSVVFNDSKWLIRRIREIKVTVENWNHFRTSTLSSKRERALACIFLNRTSFSGILAPGAGPIGGYEQASAYKIDCRFPVKTLAERIRKAASFRERVIFVKNADWRRTVKKVEQMGFKSNEVFYYLDPPFYSKAERLYRCYFEKEDHAPLHDSLVQLKQPWLLSYDPAEPILTLYSHNGCGPKRVELLYSAPTGGHRPAQELIITNLPNLPRSKPLVQDKNHNGDGEHHPSELVPTATRHEYKQIPAGV